MKPDVQPSRREALRLVVGAIAAMPVVAAIVQYLRPPAQASHRTIRLMPSEGLGVGVHTTTVFGMPVAIHRRKDGDVVAFDLACTHAGCPVQPDAAGFRCACHGGRFDSEGRPAGGPVRRPLRRITAYDDRGMVILRVEVPKP